MEKEDKNPKRGMKMGGLLVLFALPAQQHPQRIHVLDAMQSIEDIAARVRDIVG